MRVLVTGGAGYIGSHMVKLLLLVADATKARRVLGWQPIVRDAWSFEQSRAR